MIRNSLMVAAAALALAGCGGKTAEQTAADAGASASNAMEATGSAIENAVAEVAPASVAPTPDAAGFVKQAAISDMYEIAASKIAVERSKSPEIKTFAEQMIKDHTATTAKVKTITAADATLKPPAAMDDTHQKLIADLKAAKPDEFDKVYVDQQTKAHEDAHALLSGYGEKGDNATLKAFATETAPKVQGHLDMVKQLDTAGADDAMAGNKAG